MNISRISKLIGLLS